jgi:hypothetical protein
VCRDFERVGRRHRVRGRAFRARRQPDEIADAARRRVAALERELLGHRVAVAERIRERGRDEASVEERLAVAADLVALVVDRQRRQVLVRQRVTGDLVSRVRELDQLVLRHVSRQADARAVDVERRAHAVRGEHRADVT